MARSDTHTYQACDDDFCDRFACKVYKEGIREGESRGMAAGYAAGYTDGYSAGMGG